MPVLTLSPFNPNSVITRVNHNEKTEVDSFFVHVFHLAKKISDETHGAFDITVAPLVNAWGFGFKKSTGVDSLIVDSLRPMIGYQKIDLQNNRIIKKDPRIMLDCSAIMRDGSRFTDKAGYETMTFPQEVKDRDCRLTCCSGCFFHSVWSLWYWPNMVSLS